MARRPIWKTIAETLEGEISRGHYRVGEKLPTEALLATRFGVNRHTVRRALSDMAERSIVRSRRGSGVFVQAPPTDYPIGRRVRFHQNVQASGRLPEKHVLRLETRPSDAPEAEMLLIEPGAPVIVYEGLSLANGTPVAHFESVFSKARFPDLTTSLQETSSVTEALRRNGVSDYIRQLTRIAAVRASATQALHLGVREGDPLLRSLSLNTDLDGNPVERGKTWFAGDRVTLTVQQD